MSRVVKDPEVRRSELLDIAFELIQRVGFDAMSVEDVTTAANVAKGTFYHYFATKDDLQVQLLERFASGLNEHLSQVVPALSGSAPERLRGLVEAAGVYKAERIGMMSSLVYLYRKGNHGLRYRLFQAWAEATRAVLLPVVEQGIADGSFTNVDAVATSDVLLTLWYEGADRLWQRAIAQPDADTFLDVVLKGTAALQQAEERILGLAPGTVAVEITPDLTETVRHFYTMTREIVP